jgi:SAM-dependent methyltransferase
VSLARLLEHRRLWSVKPALAEVYRPWFESLLRAVGTRLRVLEIGAGPGFLAEFARRSRPDLRWITSDLLPAAWNDVAADASRLPLRDACVEAVVGLDVLHHLSTPAEFFHESARVLVGGGRLALVEPWVSPLSYPIYRWAHQEHCRLTVDPWQPFEPSRKDSFDGDAAVPWKMVRTTSDARWRELGLRPPAVQRLNAFGYLLSLGFRPGSLLPLPLARPFAAVDRWSAPIAPLTALRAVLVWEKGST